MPVVRVEVQERYNALTVKRQAETLTPDEYDELLRLTDQIEDVQARRIEYLAELARLRQTSLTSLMESLGSGTGQFTTDIVCDE